MIASVERTYHIPKYMLTNVEDRNKYYSKENIKDVVNILMDTVSQIIPINQKENLVNTLIFRLDSETSLFTNKNEEFNSRSNIIYEFISTITSNLNNHYDVIFGWKPIFCNKKSNGYNNQDSGLDVICIKYRGIGYNIIVSIQFLSTEIVVKISNEVFKINKSITFAIDDSENGNIIEAIFSDERLFKRPLNVIKNSKTSTFEEFLDYPINLFKYKWNYDIDSLDTIKYQRKHLYGN